MANKPICMEIVEQIKLLKSQGIGRKTIARQLGISKNTVKVYFEPDHPTLVNSAEQVGRLQTLHAFFPYCKEELRRTGVTRQILWGEYLQQHTSGYSYTRFCEHYSLWLSNQQATLHIEQQPGDKMYVDFTGEHLSLVDTQTGEITQVEVFLSVLGYSGLTYVKAVASQRKEDFLSCLTDALDYYGGVPKVLVPDNLKSAVDKASKYEPDINLDLLDMCNHYGMAVMPTRSRKPRDKAWVERMVNIVYSRIFAPLRNSIFTNIDDLNQAIADLLDIHNNQPFQKRETSRWSLFDEEKPLLQPLPQEHYQLKTYQKAKAMKNCHVQLHADRHYYSIPHKYIGQTSKIVYTNTHVSIYCAGERVAYHLRDRKPYKYTTIKEHLPSTHQFVSEWHPDKFIGWARMISPIVEAYIRKVLDSKSYPEQMYRSCVDILSFDKKAGRERLIAACQRATTFGVFNYKIIDQIISKKLDRQPIDDLQGTLPLHGNIRGAEYFK
jgi:transposase